MSEEDRAYVREQLKFLADLLNDMVAVEALREGLTVEEWSKKADELIARQRVRLTGKKLAKAKAMYADPTYSVEEICHTLHISAATLYGALKD